MRLRAMHSATDYFFPGVVGSNDGVTFGATSGTSVILGVASLCYPTPDVVELALMVRADCKRRGVGRVLLTHAVRWAESNGFALIIGYVHGDNRPMFSLAGAVGFEFVAKDATFFEARCRIPR